MANDWRPEIHDSDGLSMWTGSRRVDLAPAGQPGAACASTPSLDENPRGFGLLQRDRNFDHYQDDGVFYDRRPSLWVEPSAGWGKGTVQLVELPTDDETFDNIVAFWNPADKPQRRRGAAVQLSPALGRAAARSGRRSRRSSPRAPASAAWSARSATISRGASPSTSPAATCGRSPRKQRWSR